MGHNEQLRYGNSAVSDRAARAIEDAMERWGVVYVDGNVDYVPPDPDHVATAEMVYLEPGTFAVSDKDITNPTAVAKTAGMAVCTNATERPAT